MNYQSSKFVYQKALPQIIETWNKNYTVTSLLDQYNSNQSFTKNLMPYYPIDFKDTDTCPDQPTTLDINKLPNSDQFTQILYGTTNFNKKVFGIESLNVNNCMLTFNKNVDGNGKT